ncbi:unnamed protein product [Chrysoparadoxa australica]
MDQMPLSGSGSSSVPLIIVEPAEFLQAHLRTQALSLGRNRREGEEGSPSLPGVLRYFPLYYGGSQDWREQKLVLVHVYTYIHALVVFCRIPLGIRAMRVCVTDLPILWLLCAPVQAFLHSTTGAPVQVSPGLHGQRARKGSCATGLEAQASSTYSDTWSLAKAPKVSPGKFEGVRGVGANAGISPNEEFITVEAANCIITTTDQICPLEAVDNGFWRTAPWYVRLGLLLIDTMKQGEASHLSGWVKELPQKFSTPLHWDSETLEYCQYPWLAENVAAQGRNWTSIHKALTSSSPDMSVTYEEFVYALEVARSRAFSGPYEGRGPNERLAEVGFVFVLAAGYLAAGLGNVEQVANGLFAVLISIPIRDFFTSKLVPELKRYALTPGIDFLNHRSDVQSDVAFNYFYNYFGVNVKQAFNPGEQVFISYGSRSNDYLLQYYGFVEDDNPNDVYEMTSLLEKVAAALPGVDEERLALVLKSDLAGAARTASLNRDGSSNLEEVMPALRLLVLTDEQVGEQKAALLKIADFREEVNTVNEAAAVGALAVACERELEQLGCSAEEDARVLKGMGQGFSPEKTLAMRFRIQKKQVRPSMQAALATLS